MAKAHPDLTVLTEPFKVVTKLYAPDPEHVQQPVQLKRVLKRPFPEGHVASPPPNQPMRWG